MTIKIENKITGFNIVKPEKDLPAVSEQKKETKKDHIQMDKFKRPEALHGNTYKIKTPQSEHALYVTINDVILNKGTDQEIRRPIEIFLNSKNMEQFQWIAAFTLIISAIFRKGGDITFIVEELRSVFDPNGGYFKRGGKFVPSLVSEIGDVIEKHLIEIGMIKGDKLDDHQKRFLEEKRAELTGEAKSNEHAATYPAGAELCSKCNTKAVIRLDGCLTCLNCGDSKCN